MTDKLRAKASAIAARLTRWAYKPFPPLGSDGRDPFRWCIWCGCDCYEDEPQHTPDCASVTGLRPVTARELGMRGPHDPYAYGMSCMDCGEPFKVGDMSALRPTGEPDVFEAVCVGCRILNPESPQSGDAAWL